MVALKRATTLTEWLKSIPDGEEAIPEDHHVFAYAKRAGIPLEFLQLAWDAFCAKYSRSAKRYADWPQVFRNAVDGNWLRLWYIDDDSGEYRLTTAGKQRQALESRR